MSEDLSPLLSFPPLALVQPGSSEGKWCELEKISRCGQKLISLHLLKYQ